MMNSDRNKDGKYLHLIDNVSFEPIFILGMYRSGTTILYKLLAQAGCFNALNAYHIIQYDELLHNHVHGLEVARKKDIQAHFKRSGVTDRKIDEMEVGPDLEEEYGHLLGNRFRKMKIEPRSLPRFLELARKIQFMSGNGKPLLLKNPFDFWNFLQVKELIPNARFVFIHRHPFRTLSSSVRAARSSLFGRRNLYLEQISSFYRELYRAPSALRLVRALFLPKIPLGFMILFLNAAYASRYYLKNIHRLPAEDRVDVRYEDLMENPNGVVARVLNAFDLQQTAQMDFRMVTKPRETDLDQAVLFFRPFIRRRMSRYLEYFDYGAR